MFAFPVRRGCDRTQKIVYLASANAANRPLWSPTQTELLIDGKEAVCLEKERHTFTHTSYSLRTRMPVCVHYVCKGIIWAIIVQAPCGLIHNMHVLFSIWLRKPGYIPGEKVNKKSWWDICRVLYDWHTLKTPGIAEWCAFYSMASVE